MFKVTKLSIISPPRSNFSIMCTGCHIWSRAWVGWAHLGEFPWPIQLIATAWAHDGGISQIHVNKNQSANRWDNLYILTSLEWLILSPCSHPQSSPLTGWPKWSWKSFCWQIFECWVLVLERLKRNCNFDVNITFSVTIWVIYHILG